MRILDKKLHRAIVCAIMVWACGVFLSAAGPQDGQKQPANEPAAISNRGPGRKGPVHDELKLPVPHTFDLTHIDPAHYATALGNDLERIFEFVRDHIAHEVYAGCLRGPRGTLLAMCLSL